MEAGIKLQELIKARNQKLTAIVCCTLLCLLIFVSAGIVLVIYGWTCVNSNNYKPCGGTLPGSITMIVFGIFLCCCCCVGGGITIRINGKQ